MFEGVVNDISRGGTLGIDDGCAVNEITNSDFNESFAKLGGIIYAGSIS